VPHRRPGILVKLGDYKALPTDYFRKKWGAKNGKVSEVSKRKRKMESPPIRKFLTL